MFIKIKYLFVSVISILLLSSVCFSEPKVGQSQITIANFNIQAFGEKKAGKPEVMELLGKILHEFDVVAIQEIRDSSGTAIGKLEAAVDALGIDYSYVIGPRLGRTASKEEYAFLYRTGVLECIESYTFPESGKDIFHREPFIAKFRVKEEPFDFVLITIHTDPNQATEEINALPKVIEDAQKHFPDEKDFMVLGDLNADCSYFDETDQTSPMRVKKYTWLILNEWDTNLAGSSCTYDRIIITPGLKEDYTGKAGVLKFDQLYGLSAAEAKKVSDHYPVFSIFNTNKDSD